MTNYSQVEILRQGAREWARWRYKNPDIPIALRRAALSSCDLRGVILDRADLREIDLSHANLTEASLEGARLHDAKLDNANLTRARLFRAHLLGASMRQANLAGANLLETDLSRANLTGAKTSGASFVRAVLTKACLRNICGIASFNEAFLEHADFTEAELNDCDFGVANLRYADFARADLTGARFGLTIFDYTNLTNVRGLEACRHDELSTLDFRTFERSGLLPITFLRGCGLAERVVDYLPSLLNRPIEFFSCFISYNHSDKSFARRLHDQLQGRGIRCWLDEHQMRPGDDIYEEIQRGIKLWDKVLLCCSKAALTSWWVDSEIDTAFAKERELMRQRGHKVLTLIPLDTDGYLLRDWASGKAQQVRSRFAANFAGWESSNEIFEIGFERVVQALRTDELARESPPPSKL